MLQIKKVISIVLLFISTSFFLLGQSEQENSPYSFFGPGDLKNTNLPIQKAMGGVGLATTSTQQVNTTNPASLGSLKFATLHTAIFANGHWLRNDSSSINQDFVNNSFNASMEYLIIGLPFTKWWGSSIGLLPYANTSYNLLREGIATSLPDSTGLEVYNFQGKGTFYQFQWGNGFATPIKKEGFFKGNQLSIGINANYYFGNRDQSVLILKPDLENVVDIRETESLKLNDFGFHSGIQYSKLFYKNISKDPKVVKEEINGVLTIGASFKAKTNLKAKRDYVLESILFDGNNGLISVIDTIGDFLDRAEVGMVLPTQFGVGINYRKPGQWSLEANYEKFNWSEYDDGRAINLADAFKVSAGISVKPANNNTLNRSRLLSLNYRFGGYYYSNHIESRDTTSADFGLTFGFGIPLYNSLKFRRLANMNIAFNIGSRGNTLNGNVRETYFKTTLGFTFNDGNWFIKRKYE